MPRGRKKTEAAGISIRQKVYLEIQRRIATGEMAAGSSLSELDLAREMGSSRTPVREAISQLVAEGVLEQNSVGGVFVVQLTRENIIDTYELREALETYAVGKVARLGLMREEDRVQLEALVESVQVLHDELVRSGYRALDAAETNRLLAADLSFHALLIGLAQNLRIHKVVNDTRLLLRIFTIRRESHDAAALKRIHQQHKELVECIARGDEAQTCRLLSEHIQGSQRERLAEYDQHVREAAMRKSLPAFLDVYQPLVLAPRRKKKTITL
jgi:DNA-binding GntR family transcriptional regulator